LAIRSAVTFSKKSGQNTKPFGSFCLPVLTDWPFVGVVQHLHIARTMLKRVFNMAKKNSNEPIVDDELLEQAGAEPEENTVADPLEEELLEQEEDQGPENEAALTQHIADLEDRNLRLRAEFENFKRRSNREKLDLIETAGKKTMLALLPVLDDFDRAKQQALSDEGTAKV
jgi:molecular chaperone GrpE (heat shock protein)